MSGILIENKMLQSVSLGREVKVDFYLPRDVSDPSQMSLLLFNDGQNLREMKLELILDELLASGGIGPLLIAGIHAGEERKAEYGVAGIPDYGGRGAKAGDYTSFVFEELLPFIRESYKVPSFREKAFAGFSLGGLMALDIVWNYPAEFSKAGLFSGSFWWRDLDQDDPAYKDDRNRIMHQVIRKGKYHDWLKFFFQCGNMDEKKDRNQNGIIDSIDDTLDLIRELEQKGYRKGTDIHYLEMSDGRHDVKTWGKAMPEFLKWGWGREGN